RDSLDHMEVSGSRARRRHRSSPFVNRLSAIQPRPLTTPDGVSFPLTLNLFVLVLMSALMLVRMPEHRLICPISKNSSPDAHSEKMRKNLYQR
ncbi:hypothetical protein, partial [Agrobacterium rubi]